MNSSFNMEEFTNRTGHRFEDMVVDCQWRGMPCDPLDWTASYTHHGVCYTFNRQITSSHYISKSGNGMLVLVKLDFLLREQRFWQCFFLPLWFLFELSQIDLNNNLCISLYISAVTFITTKSQHICIDFLCRHLVDLKQ